MNDFNGKVAVVTGAASGIGRGMAETFAAAGMKVVLSDIEQDTLESTARALRDAGADVYAVLTDVSQSAQVDALAERTLRKYGAVHVLCNNAGVGVPPVPSWMNSLSEWQWIMGVNLMGVIHGVRTFLPIMIAQDAPAHIVNTASTAGFISDENTLYNTTKFAVVGLSESIYKELQRGHFKAKISVLCPGCVDTRILDSQRNRPAGMAAVSCPQDGPTADVVRDWYAEQLKRGLSPRAVGEQVLQAIRAERFYILTHPEYRPFIEQRMKDVLAGRNPTPMPPLGVQSLLERLSALTSVRGS